MAFIVQLTGLQFSIISIVQSIRRLIVASGLCSESNEQILVQAVSILKYCCMLIKREILTKNQTSHPVDICNQDSLFRRVDPLVVGPHTTLDGEQQHLQVSLLLEPERKRTQLTQICSLRWLAFTIVMTAFGILTSTWNFVLFVTLMPQPSFNILKIFFTKLLFNMSNALFFYLVEKTSQSISDAYTVVLTTFASTHIYLVYVVYHLIDTVCQSIWFEYLCLISIHFLKPIFHNF